MQKRSIAAGTRYVRRFAKASANFLCSIPPINTHVVPWLVKEAMGQVPGGRAVEQVTAVLARLAQSSQPILVGPWLSEVGFELLYWIPFLNWATTHYDLKKDRFIVISRGGVEGWYAHLAATYIDVFDFFVPEEFQRKNQERWMQAGNQKQIAVSDFDQEILHRVKHKLNLDEVSLLHPSLMYALFQSYWDGSGAVGLVQKHSTYQRFPVTDQSDVDKALPRDYVAVKFYFRPSFPDTAENRSFATSLVQSLAQKNPVVLLNTDLEIDDHQEYQPALQKGVHRITSRLVPRNNLEVQTQVIRQARSFVGTYGGLAYLALLCGVPGVSFYSDASLLLPAHMDIAQRVSRVLDVSFLTLQVRDAEALRPVFGNRSDTVGDSP